MRTCSYADRQWRTSSYSGADGQNGNCVEVAGAARGALLRDTKAREQGAIALTTCSWSSLLHRVTS